MTDPVTVSIAVSHSEALVVALMYGGHGIPIHIGGDPQGKADYFLTKEFQADADLS